MAPARRILVCLSAAAALLLVLGARPMAQGSGRTHTVSIQNFSFRPQQLSIRAGDTVVWVNNDDRDHAVTASDGSFRSGNLGGGQSFQFRFTRPGAYAYGCAYHPREKGSIVVASP